MECKNCKTELEENSKFCFNCGKKIEEQIKEDIGERVIADMEKFLTILEAKKKAESEKLYPCPFCNKEITIQSLKSKLNSKGIEHP